MFSVSPLSPHYDNAVYYPPTVTKHPGVQQNVDMELDGMEDENDDGSSRITSPGEAIASSSAVLRYVSGIPYYQNLRMHSLCEAATAHTLKMMKW